jgi:predicted negative regulator of RcsB-dependent stress response
MKQIFLLLLVIFPVALIAQKEMADGDTCFNRGVYTCALINYQAAYDKNLYKPEEKYLIEFRLGYCYADAKNRPVSKSYYLKSVSSKSNYLYSWWNLGYTSYNESKNDSAILCYRKALQLAINQDDKDNILYWMGWSNYNKKDYQQAAAEFKKIIGRKGNNRLNDVSIAEVYLKDNSYDSALVYAQKAKETILPADSMYGLLQYDIGKIYRGKKEFGKSLEALDIAESANPKLKMNTEWEKGLLYADKKEYSKSNEHYTNTLAFYKNDSVNTRILLNNMLLNHRSANDYTGLIAALYRHLPYSQNKENNYKEIALVQYARLKQPMEAAKTAEAALALWGRGLDSTKAGMKIWKANMLALQGLIALNNKDTATALRHFTEAVKYDYSNMTAGLRLGDIYWNRDKPDEYKKYYSGIITVSSDSLMNTREDYARAYGRKSYVRYKYYSYKPADIKTDVEFALSYDSLQKEAIYLWVITLKDHYSLSTYRDKSLALLDRGIKKYAADKKHAGDLYNAKGVLLDTKKDTSGTRKAFEEGLKIYPDNLSLWDNLLKHHQAQKNEQAGITVSDRLIAQLKKKKDSKQLAVAFIYKGDFLWRQDKKEEAKKAYNEALVWDTDNETAKARAKM